ncbi:DNA cytosine methyltransferase [Sporosarcina sp. Marseille-Q4063]|uniref:DNA cytosine methyltransferase n=1 Tax=Sporosarcina sp. Marseille-Q4063 TaxID=2810514 RepID=UPI001BAF1413|nr:DNA cytosine methyltransferase [Sporosarcina sp. Marseille-Q4063]QUW20481.1 DNA cytosine methyltransferase [Sporosarcina sp. Marseille-Q4063]
MGNLERKINLIDLFAGAGGLSNGFEQTGRFKVVGAVENNKEAVQTYVYNQGNKKDIIITPENSDISDITKIDFKRFIDEKSIDRNETVVIGGPPCQGFSNANRQKNYLISGNNQLVKEYARAIDEIRPIAFLMENVKTMNSDTHKFFVTEGTSDGIYAYSSEEHLMELITSTNENRFWDEDTLVLINTENIQLKSLMESLITGEVHLPLLPKESDISRIRSIVRRLKSEKLYNAEKIKEKQEIKSIIESLKEYDTSSVIEKDILEKILSDVIYILDLFISGANTDNKRSLQILMIFVDINQLLRYLNELVYEHILCLGNAEIDTDSSDKLKVVVKVKSYNIVKYLEVFFKYLGYQTKSDVMLASDFYTPQNRSRFMILGIKENYIKDKPVELPRKVDSDRLPFTVFDAIGDLEKINPTTEVSDYKLTYKPQSTTRMQSYYRTGMSKPIIYNHINTASRPLSRKRFKELKDRNGKNFHSLSDELKEVSYTDGSRTQNTVYLRLKYNEPSPTVINVRKSMWQHPENPVALSIREAARLQSFKDNFIFKGTKDKQYQQIGNAVPPLLARAVAEQLLLIIGEEPIQKLRTEFNN